MKKDLKKFMYSGFGITILYFLFKKILKYIIKIVSDKKVAEFKSQATAGTMKDMMESNQKSKETDEIVDNANNSSFNKLL